MAVNTICAFVHVPAYPQAKVKKEEYVEGHINL